MRRLLLTALVSAAALAAAAACSSDPSVGTGGNVDSGGGGDSHLDAGGRRDTGGGTAEDCRKTPCGDGFYCDPIDHQCYMKCGSDSSCGNPDSPRCDRATGRCVECFDDDQCGAD